MRASVLAAVAMAVTTFACEDASPPTPANWIVNRSVNEMEDRRYISINAIADEPMKGPYGHGLKHPQLTIVCSDGVMNVAIFTHMKIGTGITDRYLVRLRYDGGQRYLEHWYGAEDVLEPKDEAAFIHRLMETSRFLIEAQAVGTDVAQYMAFDTAGLANTIGVLADEGCELPRAEQ